MTQPDVALTDYGLAVECSIFAYLLGSVRGSSQLLRLWFIVYFLSIALAAAVGGTVHGFYAEPASVGSRALWPLTLIAIGITSLAGTGIGAVLQFKTPVALAISRAAGVVFLLYCIVVLFAWNDFLVAILDYLPIVLFLGCVFIACYCRTRRPAFMIGFFGLCTVLLGTAIQHFRVAIHPRYFDHNALYHAIQAVALIMIFMVARDATVQSEVRP
jgi:hypothetical protein